MIGTVLIAGAVQLLALMLWLIEARSRKSLSELCGLANKPSPDGHEPSQEVSPEQDPRLVSIVRTQAGGEWSPRMPSNLTSSSTTHSPSETVEPFVEPEDTRAPLERCRLEAVNEGMDVGKTCVLPGMATYEHAVQAHDTA